MPAAMPSSAMTRPVRVGDARHASRSAISAKPIGSARSATQTGIAALSIVPAGTIARDERDAGEAEDGRDQRRRRCRPGRCAAAPIRPFGRNSPVASVSSLPSRAAIGRPEHPEPQRQHRHDRSRPGNRRVQEAPRGNLGERQQHDAGERQARDAVLELRCERGQPGANWPCDLRNASRSCTAAS